MRKESRKSPCSPSTLSGLSYTFGRPSQELAPLSLSEFVFHHDLRIDHVSLLVFAAIADDVFPNYHISPQVKAL
jgi:hypothetical protein